uniref:Succinate:cytochrome c oxidoreductase subunit 3 n=1 Tax=Sporolithon durum TaxID=48970 RepID=V9P5C2_9FLOR|nr:succinate:cytochrome c oxidoreductase subunit 3 [Sporolithon durum]AGU16684.1 succinate:cytochrome c oxidoreductase subunit 3 [Sporolithon durum]
MVKIYNRPLSPHLTIYIPQTVSIFSILHRISALFLILFIIFVVITLKFIIFFVTDYNILLQWTENLDILLLTNIIFLSIFTTFNYHLLNGLRHINWDLGFFLDFSRLKISSILLIFFVFWIYLLSILKIWIY